MLRIMQQSQFLLQQPLLDNNIHATRGGIGSPKYSKPLNTQFNAYPMSSEYSKPLNTQFNAYPISQNTIIYPNTYPTYSVPVKTKSTGEKMVPEEESIFRSKLMKVAASYLQENNPDETNFTENLDKNLPRKLLW